MHVSISLYSWRWWWRRRSIVSICCNAIGLRGSFEKHLFIVINVVFHRIFSPRSNTLWTTVIHCMMIIEGMMCVLPKEHRAQLLCLILANVRLGPKLYIFKRWGVLITSEIVSPLFDPIYVSRTSRLYLVRGFLKLSDTPSELSIRSLLSVCASLSNVPLHLFVIPSLSIFTV